MIKFLLKDTVTMRVSTKEDADVLHKKMMEETLSNGWILSSWNEKFKAVKAKGEVVDEYMVVTYTITFQPEKEPLDVLDDIIYNVRPNTWSD